MVSAPRYVRFARSLALVAAPVVGACGGSSTAPRPPPPAASPSATVTAATVSSEEPVAPMPTDGPCRCSWDTNAQAAPRVCKRGELDVNGRACVPAGRDREEWDMPIKGPLPPPELPRRARTRRSTAARRARRAA